MQTFHQYHANEYTQLDTTHEMNIHVHCPGVYIHYVWGGDGVPDVYV